MAKTIKEIADEIGVSKQAVSYRLKQIQTAKKDTVLATKEHGVLVVSLAAETLIKQAFLEADRQKDRQKEPTKDHQKDDSYLAVLQMTITTLQGELEHKNQQLEVKDKQIEQQAKTIEDLSAALVSAQQTAHAAQALHAGTIQKQLLEGEPEETPEEKKSWLQKIFGR